MVKLEPTKFIRDSHIKRSLQFLVNHFKKHTFTITCESDDGSDNLDFNEFLVYFQYQYNCSPKAATELQFPHF